MPPKGEDTTQHLFVWTIYKIMTKPASNVTICNVTKMFVLVSAHDAACVKLNLKYHTELRVIQVYHMAAEMAR